jgi:hypothetical protein
MEYFSTFEGKHCPSSQLQMDKTKRDVQASLLHYNLETHSYNFAVGNSFFNKFLVFSLSNTSNQIAIIDQLASLSPLYYRQPDRNTFSPFAL